eukprot:jgi/Ulvmu1/1608/UM111_0037.1
MGVDGTMYEAYPAAPTPQPQRGAPTLVAAKMVAIQRAELRVPAPKHARDIVSLVQPGGAFSGLSPPIEHADQGAEALSDGRAAVDDVALSTIGTAPETVAAPAAQMSPDVALREFLKRVHAAGMMLDEPTWRLEVQGAEVLLCATFHMIRDRADDLFSVFRRCSLFQRLTSFDVINIDDHTDNLDPSARGAAGGADTKFDQAREGVVGQLKLEKLIERVRTNAQLSFDYLTLLIVASCLAGLGLGSNNTVIIIASMLVSPLMGPVLAITFGANVHDRRLARLGFVAGSLSMLICAAVGAALMIAFGGIIGRVQYCAGEWPPEEMRSRGNIGSMWLNFGFAVASAVGIAVGLANDNAASMVGTAISASLLPPAVNAGMFWGYTAVHSIYNNPDFLGRESCPESCVIDCATQFGCPNGDACDDAARLECTSDCPDGCMPWCPDNPGFTKTDFMEYGGYSMLLTVVNILVINVVGVGMLRAQELGPRSSAFWKEDVGVARKLRTSNLFRDLGGKLRGSDRGKAAPGGEGYGAGGQAAGGRQLRRTVGGRAIIGEDALDDIIHSVEAAALGGGGSSTADAPGHVAGQYLNLLNVAHRRATAEGGAARGKGAGEDVLEDMYALFGAKKKSKASRLQRKKQMDELARAGNDMDEDDGGSAV